MNGRGTVDWNQAAREFQLQKPLGTVPIGRGMDRSEILDRIKGRLEPQELFAWFLVALPEIESAVLSLARVEGIESAVRGIKELYLSSMYKNSKAVI